MSQEHSSSLEDSLQARARAVAAELGETTPESLDQILRLLKLQGEEFVDACRVEALAIQARGGERLPNGGRPRTLGGIFFRLTRARREAAGGEASPLPGPAAATPTRRPMPWEVRRELLPALHETKGETMSIKVMLSGRPGKVERREGTVVLMMAAGDAPPLPRGVPRPPAAPAPFACYIDAQQWAEVEPALADPADMLILDGYCAGDPEMGTVAVYVQSATTRNLQRASAAASKNKGRRSTFGGPSAARGAPITAPRPLTMRAEPPRSPLPSPATPTPTPSAPAAPEAAEPGLRFQKGMRVRHPQFGEGDVIRSEAREGDEAVTVDFASTGLRRVLARAAGLEIIGT
jgi:PHAX RNA-binding domain